MSRKQGLIALALESQTEEQLLAGEGPEGEEVPTEVEVDNATDFIDSPETADADVAEIEGDIADTEASLDQGEQVAEKVEEVAQKIDAAADAGGMTEEAAEAMGTALEALRMVVGYPDNGKMNVSFEAFGNKETRVEATKKLALEAAVTGKGIWQALANGLAQLVQFVKNLIAAAIDAAERHRQRAVKLADLAGKLGSKQAPAGTKVKSGGLVKILNVGGRAPSGSEFVNQFGKFVKELDSQGVASYIKAVDGIAADAVGLIDNVKDEGKFKSMQDSFKQKAAAVAGSGDANPVTPLTFGQQEIFGAPTEGGGFKYGVRSASSAKEVAGDSEFEVLNAKQAQQVAQATAAGLKSWIDASKQLKSVDGTVAKLNAAVRKANGLFGALDRGDEAKRAREAAAAARTVIEVVTGLIKSTRQYDLTVLKAANEYTASSLKALNGQEEAKPGQNNLPAPAAAAA